MGKDPTTFVSSDHGFAPQFLAIDASQPLVELGLLSRPQTSNCRPATGETIGKAKACWAGGALQIYLNVAGRDPAGGGLQQVPAADVDATVAAIKAKYLGLTDPNDWTHDGQPEGWKMIDRAFTKAEARYIPNGPEHDGRHGPSDADGRPGRLRVPAVPVRRGDAGHARRRRRTSSASTATCPDVQDLAANVNMRATFLAGGEGVAKGEVRRATIDLAPTLAFLLGIPEPQHSQGRVLLDVLKGGELVQADLDRRPERLPRPARPDDARRSTASTPPVGGAAFLATMFDEELAAPAGPGPDPGRRRQRRRLAAELGAAGGQAGDRRRERVGPGRHVLRQPRVRLRRRAAARAPGAGELPVPGDEHRRDGDRASPAVGDAVGVFKVNGIKVGVIGAELENTPELVSAGATAGPAVPRRGAADQGRVRAAPPQGVKVQIVVIHQGTTRAEPDRQRRRRARGKGPILGIADALQDTTVDAMIVGHTHRISNLMRGDILITEGINAGTSYSVLQLMVKGGDVAWAGGATRVAKNLGVAQRADVQAIVDDANAQTAVLRNQVIGTQSNDILRAPTRLHESEMGNMVADAMRAKYPGVDAAYHELRRPPADLLVHPAERGRAAGRDHLGRDVRRPAVRQPDDDPRPSPAPSCDRPSSTASRRSATRASRAAPVASRRSRA